MKFPIGIYKIAEQSMEPEIELGSYALVNKWYGKLSVGEIVIVRSPQDDRILIKRIEKISNGSLFLVGDNEGMSVDSRQFGWVDEGNVMGKLVAVL